VIAEDDEDDEDDDEDPPKLATLANRHRRYERTHEYVSEACAHRQHEGCRPRCFYCRVTCLCVCHHWAVAVENW
jgi:hypothetical protein